MTKVWIHILLALCVLLTPAFGQENPTPPILNQPHGGAVVPLKGEDHVLRPGDQLELNISSLPDLPTTYVVRVDGHFYHPLVGDLKASGKTLGDLRAEIARKLKRELRNPRFRLGLIQVAQHQVAVLGEAQNQGTFQVGVGATVLDVIASAGGLTDKADDSRAVLLRGQERIEVSLSPEEGGGLTPVRSGDILYIIAGSPVSVSGEVTNPGVYSVSRVNGSPRDLLIAAGGAKEEASLRRVRLIRATLPEPLTLDLRANPESALPPEAQVMQEGDILVVPARQAVVLGAVAKPGPVPLRGGESLIDILGPRVGAQSEVKHILVVRADDVMKNRDKKEEYNLEEFFKEGLADVNIPIRDGDLVYVPQRDPNGGFFGRGFNILSVLGIARLFF